MDSKYFVIITLGLLFFGCLGEEPLKPTENITNVTKNVTALVPNVTETLTQTLTNCNTDMDCFISAANTCSKADISFTYSIDLFGVTNATTTKYMLINGTEAGKCLFYYRIDNVSVKFSQTAIQQALAQNITMAQIEQQEQAMNNQSASTIGTYQRCTFNSSFDLAAMLKRWKNGEFNSGDVRCTITTTPPGCTVKTVCNGTTCTNDPSCNATTVCTMTGGDFANATCVGSASSMIGQG